jgi:hypothetical protein
MRTTVEYPVTPFQTPFKNYSVDQIKEVWLGLIEKQEEKATGNDYYSFAILDDRSAKDKTVLIATTLERILGSLIGNSGEFDSL